MMQHERRCVRVAADSIRMLARRVGPVNTDEIPRAIRRPQWPALNVPLLWVASTGDIDHPFFGDHPHSSGYRMACGHVKIWPSRSFPWGSQCFDGALISAAGPRKGSSAKPAVDARVSGLESLFVRLFLAESRGPPDNHQGTWRVATRLAVLGFFHFRLLLPEVRII